jgi:outer membrane biogenesis lipoprotein LolB
MRPKPLKQLVLVLSLLFMAGCSHRISTTPPPLLVAYDDWLRALALRTATWNEFQARANIQGDSPEKKFSLDALCVARMPSQLRLEGFRFGQTASVLTVNHADASLLVPSEKVLYRAASSEILIYRLLGFGIPLELFGSLLNGTIPGEYLKELKVVPQGAGWLGVARDARSGRELVWEFTDDPQGLKSVVIKSGDSRLVVLYDPPVGPGAEDHPQKMILIAPPWELTVVIKEIKLASSLMEGIFLPVSPAGIRQVTLHALP